jgi:ABC-type nitrate/sulfonate/bicarbonate transport system substrate-binding protein
MSKRNRLRIIACLIFLAMSAQASLAQEKKNIRMVFVSLAWNSEIPFPVALVRGFFKQQGLQVEPILIRGGPAAIEKGIIAAAPFSPEDGVRLIKAGYSVISNLSESLGIPQNILVTRNEMLEKYPETSKRMLKAYIQGIHLAKFNKKEAIKAGYESGLQGDPENRQRGTGSLLSWPDVGFVYSQSGATGDAR